MSFSSSFARKHLLLSFFEAFTSTIQTNLANIFKTVCHVGQNKEKTIFHDRVNSIHFVSNKKL